MSALHIISNISDYIYYSVCYRNTLRLFYGILYGILYEYYHLEMLSPCCARLYLSVYTVLHTQTHTH